MLVSWANETVEVLRPQEVVEWGQTVVDWENLVPHEVYGCAYYYLDPAETVQGVDVVAGTLALIMPFDADILGTDRVRFQGKIWEVIGQPSRQPSPLATLSHTAVTLKHWEGKK